jgi:hypothetical protein
MGVSWLEIPGAIRNILLRTTERLATEFKQQEISNIIYRFVSVHLRTISARLCLRLVLVS